MKKQFGQKAGKGAEMVLGRVNSPAEERRIGGVAGPGGRVGCVGRGGAAVVGLQHLRHLAQPEQPSRKAVRGEV